MLVIRHMVAIRVAYRVYFSSRFWATPGQPHLPGGTSYAGASRRLRYGEPATDPVAQRPDYVFARAQLRDPNHVWRAKREERASRRGGWAGAESSSRVGPAC